MVPKQTFYMPVGSKGQVTIPKKIRDTLHIHSGDNVLFIMEADKVRLSDAKLLSLEEIFQRPVQKSRIDVLQASKIAKDEKAVRVFDKK